jgi:hypothetical protein
MSPHIHDLEDRHRAARKPARRSRRWNDDPIRTPPQAGQDDGRVPSIRPDDWIRLVVATNRKGASR